MDATTPVVDQSWEALAHSTALEAEHSPLFLLYFAEMADTVSDATREETEEELLTKVHVSESRISGNFNRHRQQAIGDRHTQESGSNKRNSTAVSSLRACTHSGRHETKHNGKQHIGPSRSTTVAKNPPLEHSIWWIYSQRATVCFISTLWHVCRLRKWT